MELKKAFARTHEFGDKGVDVMMQVNDVGYDEMGWIAGQGKKGQCVSTVRGLPSSRIF